MNRHLISVDIGGTRMRAASYPEDSLTPLKIDRITTKGPGSPLDRLVKLIASVWPEQGDVVAMGVAVAGPLDPYQGIVFRSPNIPSWVNLPLRQHLADHFKVPVALGNDANMAALAEWKMGAGRGHHDMIYLTVSTGIGGGVVANDQLLLGARGLATEMGHVTVLPDGPVCSCGHRGHLEAIASGPAIARWCEEEIRQGTASSLPGGSLTTEQVAEAARQGDPLSVAAIERAGYYLGQALADFLHLFNPTAVVIGGGVSHCGPYLFDPLKTSLNKHAFSPQYLENLTIATAILGDNVGLMGALALAQSIIEA